MRGLLRDRWFVGHALAGGLAFGALFAYISGSSFVLQGIYGVSPQLYSVLFADNGLGLIAGSQVNARARRPLRAGPAAALRAHRIAVSAAALLVVVFAGGLGVGAVLAPMFVIVSSLSFVLPNSTALALADHADGGGDRVRAARRPPVPGRRGGRRRSSARAGTDSAVPMAAVMTARRLGALVARRRRGHPRARRRGAMTLVTISAAYGAGGSRIAPALAERLGVPFLGRPPVPELLDDAEADARPARAAAPAAACSPGSPRWPSPGARRRA